MQIIRGHIRAQCCHCGKDQFRCQWGVALAPKHRAFEYAHAIFAPRAWTAILPFWTPPTPDCAAVREIRP
jgi:hypothetical protein